MADTGTGRDGGGGVGGAAGRSERPVGKYMKQGESGPTAERRQVTEGTENEPAGLDVVAHIHTLGL